MFLAVISMWPLILSLPRSAPESIASRALERWSAEQPNDADFALGSSAPTLVIAGARFGDFAPMSDLRPDGVLLMARDTLRPASLPVESWMIPVRVEPEAALQIASLRLIPAGSPAQTDHRYPIDPAPFPIPANPSLVVFALASVAASNRRRRAG